MSALFESIVCVCVYLYTVNTVFIFGVSVKVIFAVLPSTLNALPIARLSAEINTVSAVSKLLSAFAPPCVLHVVVLSGATSNTPIWSSPAGAKLIA